MFSCISSLDGSKLVSGYSILKLVYFLARTIFPLSNMYDTVVVDNGTCSSLL